jgi:hypothetical protein
MTIDTPSTPITFRTVLATREPSMNDRKLLTVGLRSPVSNLSIRTPPAVFGSDLTIFAYRARREYRAKVPPSPSSSALRTMNIYLMVTMSVNVQIMIESAPTRSSYEGWLVKVEE